MSNAHKIRSVGLRWIINILFLGLTAGGFMFFTSRYAEELNKYSLNNIASTAAATRGWIQYASGDEGSSYDLGTIDGSIGSVLTKFPQGVVVTLFRPFLWESKKPIVALSALESLAFLYLTLRLFFRNGFKTFKLLSSDPNLVFFFVFSVIFAFAVGVSSYNFGALSRYKIPCMPFYAAFLILSMNKEKEFQKEKKLTQIRKFQKVRAI
jgi:hypothetical protein